MWIDDRERDWPRLYPAEISRAIRATSSLAGVGIGVDPTKGRPGPSAPAISSTISTSGRSCESTFTGPPPSRGGVIVGGVPLDSHSPTVPRPALDFRPQ